MTTLMKLSFWENVYEIQNNLLEIIKAVTVPRNFTLFLRYSQLILKLFLQNGIPMVESSFKSHTDRVIHLLKSVQGTTRFLHKLCCQSKSVKNSAVIALIPDLRQSLERFNYCVKAALVANKCSSSFLLGNLKNNDMQGEAILSQVMMNDDDGEGDEEPFPSDDETVTGASYLGITTMCHEVPETPEPVAAGSSKGKRKSRARK